MVCGPVADKGAKEIRRLQALLGEKGFEVVDQLSGLGDYSHIADFRERRGLAEEITKHDLDRVTESDVIIALYDGPSYGTAIEIFFAKRMGKRVMLLSRGEVPSPWPVAFSDVIVGNEEGLILALKGHLRGA